MAVDDDLIFTLSDGDVSDEDVEESEAPVSAPEVMLSTKKRKRTAEKQTSVKKAKGPHAARGQQDDEDESDFEFETGDAALQDLDAWAFNVDASSTKQPGDIDAIVARRRPAVQDVKSDSSEDEVEEDDGVEVDDDDADSVDGVDGDVNGTHETLSDSASQKSDSEHGSDADDGQVAAPVPHPADVHPDDDDDEEEEEDAVEAEKRNAFFAQDSESRPTTASVAAFHTLNLSRPILKGLASVGFTKPTPIQSKTIPVALEGKDLVGGAVTGSGKTAAFLIPILERLLFRPKRNPTTRVVILMPTRELALQCFQVATKLASFTDITFGQAIGGLNSREQEKQLKARPDVVIATPGRFIDLERNTASLAVNTVEILVLDEADRMLEEGFADELNEILAKIPKSRQTMLFSATMTSKVDDLIRVGLQRPVRLMVDAQRQTVSGLVQEFVRLRPGREGKRLAYLMHLCEKVHTDRTIVFFRQKKEAHRVRVIFALCGLHAAELHGAMSQEQRIHAIEAFRTGRAAFLLATDLASRGLDIKGIDTVINYEAPQTHEIYLHRVGRTARAGRTGRSCTLAAEPDRKVVKAAVKAAKAQGATIRQRTIEAPLVDAWHTRLAALEPDIEAVLREEKEEKALQQVDRDLTRADNIVKHEDEIKARPKRTWFESEKDKQASRDKGAAALNGPADGAAADAGKRKKKAGGKLSNKEKKKLLDRDDRVAGREGKKKASTDRLGKGGPKDGKVKKKTTTKMGGKPRR